MNSNGEEKLLFLDDGDLKIPEEDENEEFWNFKRTLFVKQQYFKNAMKSGKKLELSDDENVEKESELVLENFHSGQPKEFFTNRLCSNAKIETIKLKIEGASYLVPGNARFILADVEKVVFDEKFDVVYLDPPWKNKSVSRGKSTRRIR
ncbi:Oidioi.mRNA.OKI2018_I69.XSR.g13762.t1.cds [Oikopleura dioica]|uniref:Oidioi.mRNA.OKI2018_I69.XSR.g13762.t1.cds n=1 Tax=Oikopleura dioica TaxID=34765 RepID=A0ABN7SBK9_OIKDI|nr:Oidioi.mRNA.OKI2018_I69.XSR.g13762.t1.cds [Oikopleura dioica]